MVGKHNALDSVSECGKPLIEISVNVFAASREKLPAGMFKFSLQLVEQAPALTHLRLKSAGSDRNQETEHDGSDLRDCRDRTVGPGSHGDQRGDDGCADHDEPAGKVERVLCPLAHNVGHQHTLTPLEAYVFLSFAMIGPLIDERRCQPVDPAARRRTTPSLPSAKEAITHAHSMT